ncbi:hypothetical protein [Variovorax sp. GT1P44]|uniref:hypothetical protein n=1 Tax=Variovorax sp. GT1P44 TaxID=3443742 RepID=UPI003F47E1C0
MRKYALSETGGHMQLDLHHPDASGDHSTRGFTTRPISVEPPIHAVLCREVESQRDAAFIALLSAFRPTGGLFRGDELADLLIARRSGDHASLARSIVSGEILCFDWNRTLWIPAFQLDRDSLAAGIATRRVLAELSRIFDGWSAAHWFVAPNAWLQERAPIELLDAQFDAVLHAARAQCFAA